MSSTADRETQKTEDEIWADNLVADLRARFPDAPEGREAMKKEYWAAISKRGREWVKKEFGRPVWYNLKVQYRQRTNLGLVYKTEWVTADLVVECPRALTAGANRAGDEKELQTFLREKLTKFNKRPEDGEPIKIFWCSMPHLTKAEAAAADWPESLW
jgi:hypothetical protein